MSACAAFCRCHFLKFEKKIVILGYIAGLICLLNPIKECGGSASETAHVVMSKCRDICTTCQSQFEAERTPEDNSVTHSELKPKRCFVRRS